MEDVIDWCEQRGMEVERVAMERERVAMERERVAMERERVAMESERNPVDFRAETANMTVFARDSTLHVVTEQPSVGLETQIRADEADVEVQRRQLYIRRDRDTRVVIGPKLVLDSSEGGDTNDAPGT